MSLKDYSDYEIGQAKFTYGGEFWDKSTDDEKVMMLLQLDTS